MAKLKTEHLFLITIFVISTCGLIYELIAGALASYLLGDSIMQFSLIIGIYLFSMGVGSYLSKFIKSNLINKFIEIEILIGLIGGMSAPLLFLLFDVVEYFEVYLYFFVFVIGVLVGLEIPLLMIILKDKFQFNELVSNVFTFDYIGALIASILFPVFFIPYLGLIETSLIFGIVNVLVAIIMSFAFKNLIRNSKFLRFKAYFSVTLLIIALFFSGKILSYSERNLYGENVVLSKNSKYQRIVLTHEREDYRLYLNNNLQFSTLDEYRYHEMLVHPAMSFSENIDSVLILGGGDGMAAREVLKYNEVKSITLVDLDREMTAMFKNNMLLRRFNKNSLRSNKLRIINNDAFVWLKDCKTKYDVVIIDFPDPSNFSLGKLYSTFFYSNLKKILKNETIVVVQSTSPYFAPKSFWCINSTLANSFNQTMPYHIYLPSFGEWGFSMASDKLITQKKYRNLEGLKFYDNDFEKFCYFPKDMKVAKVEINKLNNQNLVNYFNEEWSKY